MRGCHVYFDNLFTLFKLLNELSNKGLGGTGTVCQYRWEKLLLLRRKVWKKTVSHGSCEVVFKEDVVLEGWKGVYIASKFTMLTSTNHVPLHIAELR